MFVITTGEYCYVHTHTHTHTHTTSFVTSKIAIAVAAILGATCVQAAVAADGHTFDKQTNTHIWQDPKKDTVFFPETSALQNGQNAKFNSTSSRWLLKDFNSDFAYTLDKVSFTNAPTTGAHAFLLLLMALMEQTKAVPLILTKHI